MSTPVNDRYEDSRDISLLAKDQYFRELRWREETEPLTEEEERKLFNRLYRARVEPSNAWAQNLAKHARERLVEAYQPLVYGVARRFLYAFRLEWLDLVQEGSLGLLTTLDSIVYTDRDQFRACATMDVRDAIYRSLHRDSGAVCLKQYGAACIKTLRAAERRLSDVLGRFPTPTEVAREMDISVDRVHEIRSWRSCARAESIQALVKEDDAEDRHSFTSLFASSSEDDVDRQVMLRACIEQALEKAVPEERQRHVLRLRFGLTETALGGLQHKEIVQILGGFESGVGRSERRGLDCLRNALDLVVKNGRPFCELRRPYRGDYYTVADVAALLNVTPEAVRSYARRGRFAAECHHFKKSSLWMFPKQVIDAYIAQRPDYYTVADVAALLNVSPSMVCTYARQGRFAAERQYGKNWVFPKQAIDAYIAQRQEVSA